jgi:flagellar protein FliO/FliZ
MTETKSMRSAIWTMALLLLSACPAELSAQATPITEAKAHNSVNRTEPGKKPDGLPSAVTVFGSLALVLGVFFALVWALRRASPPGAALLPTEAFEVLGRAPLANRQQAHLLRCGNKLLLISAGAAGTEPLTEITDPAEVERLTDLCRQARPNVATTALRRMFRQKGESNG